MTFVMIFVIPYDVMSGRAKNTRGKVAFRAATAGMTHQEIAEAIFDATGQRVDASTISRWFTDGSGGRKPDGDSRVLLQKAFPSVWADLWSVAVDEGDAA